MTLPPSEDDKSHTPKFDLTSFACTPVHDGSKIPSRRPSNINSQFKHTDSFTALPPMKALLSVFQGSRLGASARRVLEITQTHIHIHTIAFTPWSGRSGASNDLHGRVHGRL